MHPARAGPPKHAPEPPPVKQHSQQQSLKHDGSPQRPYVATIRNPLPPPQVSASFVTDNTTENILAKDWIQRVMQGKDMRNMNLDTYGTLNKGNVTKQEAKILADNIYSWLKKILPDARIEKWASQMDSYWYELVVSIPGLSMIPFIEICKFRTQVEFVVGENPYYKKPHPIPLGSIKQKDLDTEFLYNPKTSSDLLNFIVGETYEIPNTDIQGMDPNLLKMDENQLKKMVSDGIPEKYLGPYTKFVGKVQRWILDNVPRTFTLYKCNVHVYPVETVFMIFQEGDVEAAAIKISLSNDVVHVWKQDRKIITRTYGKYAKPLLHKMHAPFLDYGDASSELLNFINGSKHDAPKIKITGLNKNLVPKAQNLVFHDFIRRTEQWIRDKVPGYIKVKACGTDIYKKFFFQKDGSSSVAVMIMDINSPSIYLVRDSADDLLENDDDFQHAKPLAGSAQPVTDERVLVRSCCKQCGGLIIT